MTHLDELSIDIFGAVDSFDLPGTFCYYFCQWRGVGGALIDLGD